MQRSLSAKMRPQHLLLFILISNPESILAQENTSNLEHIEEIIVTSTGLEEKQSRLPIAVGVVSKNNIQLGRQQLSLDESLSKIPGIFFQNRQNFAQDLRVSIRGFGARSSFGIRGIKIFADDIPLTLPDGQSSVDAIDLGSAKKIEVVRSPVSSIHGASSGGVINITTEDGTEIPFLSSRVNFGSFNFAQEQVKAGGQLDNSIYLINASNTRLDGYRDHSKYRSLLLNSKFRYYMNDDSELTVLLNAVNSPKAEDPGALNKNEVLQNRKQAAPRNLLFDAGEELNQETLGLTLTKELSSIHKIKFRTHFVDRDFKNKLPFVINSNGQGGSVKLDRLVTGAGANYIYSGNLFNKSSRMMFGFDIDAQQDQRKRYANNQGVLGILTTNQDEDVTSYGYFFQNALEITKNVVLTIGSRYDEIKYDVDDKTGGNGSGTISFYELSPMIGFNWSIQPAFNLYGNVAQSFDPPTTTELANPNAESGFNSALKPQTALNFEIGLKGVLVDKLNYEIALFHIDVDDELIRYELTGSGQSFYENAGSSTHEGLEIAFSMQLFPGLTSSLAYTYSDFTFDTFRDRNGNNYSGNKIPGVPDNKFHFQLAYQQDSGFYTSFELLHANDFYANNANTVKSDAYTVSNIRAGFQRKWNHWEFSPFIGINNMFNEEYFDNIRLNASFGRYFEPASDRNYYGGFNIRYTFE
jgi:iron complex outermembrane receptor protein